MSSQWQTKDKKFFNEIDNYFDENDRKFEISKSNFKVSRPMTAISAKNKSSTKKFFNTDKQENLNIDNETHQNVKESANQMFEKTKFEIREMLHPNYPKKNLIKKKSLWVFNYYS